MDLRTPDDPEQVLQGRPRTPQSLCLDGQDKLAAGGENIGRNVDDQRLSGIRQGQALGLPDVRPLRCFERNVIARTVALDINFQANCPRRGRQRNLHGSVRAPGYSHNSDTVRRRGLGRRARTDGSTLRRHLGRKLWHGGRRTIDERSIDRRLRTTMQDGGQDRADSDEKDRRRERPSSPPRGRGLRLPRRCLNRSGLAVDRRDECAHEFESLAAPPRGEEMPFEVPSVLGREASTQIGMDEVISGGEQVFVDLVVGHVTIFEADLLLGRQPTKEILGQFPLLLGHHPHLWHPPLIS